MEYRKAELIKTKSRIVVARGYRMGEWGDTGQRVQTSIYNMNKFRGSNVQCGDFS